MEQTAAVATFTAAATSSATAQVTTRMFVLERLLALTLLWLIAFPIQLLPCSRKPRIWLPTAVHVLHTWRKIRPRCSIHKAICSGS